MLRGTARIIRADRGTENVNVAAMQRFFRQVPVDGSDEFSEEEKVVPTGGLGTLNI